MCSQELPDILESYRPPREHVRALRTQAARAFMERWAVDAVKRQMNCEMCAVKIYFLSPQDGLSETTLLELDVEALIDAVKEDAPTDENWRDSLLP